MKRKKPRYVHEHLSDGKPYLYFRRSGQPKVRLRGPIFSREFYEDYDAALKGSAAKRGADTSRLTAGTFDALIVQYYNSPLFTALEASTQRTYRSQIEPFRFEYGKFRVSTINAANLDTILGRMAAKSTAQASKFYMRLSTLFKLALKWNYRPDNPMSLMTPIKHKSKGYVTWTEEDIQKYRDYWAKGTPQRLAMEVLLNTGLRRSDAVRLGRQHRSDNGHAIKIRKTHVDVFIPVTADLDEHLSLCADGSLTYILTVHGATRSEKAFTNWLREAAQRAGLQNDRSPHGLRKAACRRLAEAGCSASQIMSITGHQNIAEVERYVIEANKQLMARAAVVKYDEHTNKLKTKTG